MMGQGRMIKKLLGQHSNDNKSDASSSFESRPDPTYPRPNTSQSAYFHAGASLQCLDRSPDGNFAVVAGEKVFKILKVSAASITEETDLRPTILSQNNGHNEALPPFRDRLNISITKWMQGNLDSTIITASPNGKLALYDVKRPGEEMDVGRVEEHKREIHALAVNPHRYQQFVTACHDGSARLYDLNEPDLRRAQVFRSKAVFKGNSDAIRDISWSPVQGQYFACVTNSGSLQLWDRRTAKAPLVDIKTAHSGGASSVSWHPDGTHVVSGGFDRVCRIWEIVPPPEKGRRLKSKYDFQTPAPISTVSWRPPCWSWSANGKRAAQIVVAYSDKSSTNAKISIVHVWDLGRKTLPYKEICDQDTSPSGLLWHDQDLLWTVNRSGSFKQTDLKFAPKVIDKKSLSTFDFSPSGEILLLLQERERRERSLSPQPSEPSIRQKISGSQSQSPSGVAFSGSKSDSDEDVVGSFLGGRTAKGKRFARRPSNRSNNSLSTTPPSVNGTKDLQLISLEEAINVSEYKPQQTMGHGHAPSTARRDIYQYLSSRYLEILTEEKRRPLQLPSEPSKLAIRLQSALQRFASAAHDVRHFRLAQTWKILAYSMGLLLERRAEYHMKQRLARASEHLGPNTQSSKGRQHQKKRQDEKELDDDTPKKAIRPRSPFENLMNPITRSIIAEEAESTSNMTTPLARPMRDSLIIDKHTNQPSSMDDDELSLPPAVHTHSPRSIPVIDYPSPVRDDVAASSSDGYDFYDTGSFATQAIDITSAPQRKSPLRLDYDSAQQTRPQLGRTDRHDSAESFEMFSTSGESHRSRFPSSESSGIGSVPLVRRRISVAGDSSWESSGPLDTREFPSYDSNDGLNGPTASTHAREVRIEDEGIDADEEAMMKAAIADATAEDNSYIDESSNFIIDKDFYPLPSDPSFLPEPIDPHILVQRTLQFEVLTGVLNASALILALNHFLLPNTIDAIQAASILRQYHHRLSTMNLFTEAALLRRLAYPSYRSTYSQGLHDVTIGFVCPECNAPTGDEATNSSHRLEKCNKCRIYLDGCSVCQSFGLPDSSFFSMDEHLGSSSLHLTTASRIDPSPPPSPLLDVDNNKTAHMWWYCPGCGHGGHTSCMTEWHGSGGSIGPSEGCCPAENCLHPCLPGPYRDEYDNKKRMVAVDATGVIAKENLKGVLNSITAGGESASSGARQSGFGIGAGSGNGRASVRRDEKGVGESRAVESVRGHLSGASGSGGGSFSPGSLGLGAGSLERKKSVKVVAPGEEKRR